MTLASVLAFISGAWKLLTSPAGMAAVFFLLLTVTYEIGRRDGYRAMEARIEHDNSERVRRAVRAGDNAVSDPERLRSDDGYQRP